MKTCPYVCNNKSVHGYCMSTVCINPLYNRITINQWMEKADYVQVVRCKDCKHYREADPGHPDCDWCNRMICGTIRKGFFCADGERKDEEA